MRLERIRFLQVITGVTGKEPVDLIDTDIIFPSLRRNMEIVASVLTKLATSIKVALMRTYFMIGLNIERSQRSVWLTTILITSNLGFESN